MDYQKRLGTSGVEGQLYETKVIALIMLRLLHDERVADFCLATNMEGMGAFDDICFRVSVVGRERPLLLFVQLKHKIHDDATLTIHDNSTDLVKYIDSFITITKKIASQNNCDIFFDKSISKTDSMFILYTNAEFKISYSAPQTEDSLKRFVSSYDSLVNELLVTGASVGRRLRHSELLLRDFATSKLKEDLTVLAERLATFMFRRTKRAHIMNDEYLQQYHVALARHVVHVGDIQTDEIGRTTWRNLSFRNEFFDSPDEPVALFRRELFKQILKEHPKTVSRGTDSTASERRNDGIFNFFNGKTHSDVQTLNRMKVSPEITAEAYLRSLKMDVPVGFGNVDMVMSGGAKKIEKRNNYLVTGILDMCQRYEQVETLKVVTIDETVDGGLLAHSGGLASGVGNLLMWDESTDMLKFTDRFTSRQSNAETLFTKLKEKIEKQSVGTDHLPDYRFKLKSSKLPKLRFDCTNTTREFISKLVIYDKQSNQSQVEELLKDEVQNLLYKKAHHSALQCHSVFLHYHDEVVNWWLRPSGRYLNKASNLYELAINNIKAEPQISALHTTFHVNNSKFREYRFNETTPKWSALAQLPAHMSIVTDTVTLTTINAIQCLQKFFTINKYAVFDMESVANLSTADFCSLQLELRETEKVLIIAWRHTDSGAVSHTMLNELAQATEGKKIVILTNNMNKVYEYFPHIDVFREDTLNFTLLTTDSQKELKKNCKVTFQGVELSLDLLMDNESLSFLKGVVLDKLTRHEAISFGTALGDPRYEEIKHFYIERNVCYTGKRNARYLVRTFYDIADDVVLLTAPPGMGKSTLLTRLSINTKELDPTLWIVRVNFINHSKQFQKWCDDDTRVGAVEALKFLCQVVIRDESVSFSVQLTNDEASLVNCATDGLTTFELHMFLHYYNRQRLMFIFDGFDEICPHYKDKVVDFLTVVKMHLRKTKMWVTSRPYSHVLPALRRALGGDFEMEHLSYREQESFLKSFWREKSINEKLSKQLESLETFIENTSQSISELHEWVQFVYYNFVDVVQHVLFQSRLADIEGHLERFRRRPVKDTMSGIPLILYFMADYFVHIVGSDKKRIKSKLVINLHDVYEMFVENKVNKILYKDKNNMELSNPITRDMLDRELHDCTRVYKKLAANALFQGPIFRELSFKEFEDIVPLGNKELYAELYGIKIGKDKTGLISHVTASNEVVFIHRSFTEYFAAEYACDILKSRKFNKFVKLLWYCALTFDDYEGIRDWMEAKKKIDKTLRNVFKEIEEPAPIYVTDFYNYLALDNLSKKQHIRILASTEEDYNDISFKTLSDMFPLSYWKTLNDVTRQNISEYLQSHIINQMKVHLREHFADEPLFVLMKNTFRRSNTSVSHFVKALYFEEIRLKIKIMGHKGAVPMLLRLEHKDDDDVINFDVNGFKTNSEIDYRADDTQISHMYILYNNDEFSKGFYTKHEPDSVRAFDTLIATTSTVRCRLQNSEQNVQEFANIRLKKELSLFVEYLSLILSPNVGHTFMVKDFSYFQRYRYREFLEEKHDLNNPDCQILMFRDDFLYANDTHTNQLRNYLIEEILRKPAINYSNYITPEELITSFLSAPSTATLTPLIGAFIVCCEEGELKFAISTPPNDTERLRRVKMQRSEIDEALGAVRTAVIEYLRSLQLKVPPDLNDVDLMLMMVNRNPMSIVDSVNLISAICEQHVRKGQYKVVTIDTRNLLFQVIGGILTFDEQSDMLKFSNSRQFRAAQIKSKLILKKLLRKKNDLHEYRFRLKYNKLSNLYADCSDTAREFLDKLVIYAKRGNYYRVENILERKVENPNTEKYLHLYIKSQLKLLHYHSETVKWWMLPSMNANLTKTLLRYAEGIVKWMSRGGVPRRSTTRDLYRRAAYNVTTEPLISELHTKFHMNYFKYFDNSYYKGNSKWKEILEIPCRTLIETDAVTLIAIEVVHFLRNNDSLNNFTILELNYVFAILRSRDRRMLCTELRQTDKVLIVVWHTPRHADIETLHELAEAIKEKNIIVVTNNEFRKYRSLLRTNRVFNCKSELWSAALQRDVLKTPT